MEEESAKVQELNKIVNGMKQFL